MLDDIWHQKHPEIPIVTHNGLLPGISTFSEYLDLREPVDIFDTMRLLMERTINRFDELVKNIEAPYGKRIILCRHAMAPMGLSAWITPVVNKRERILQISWTGYVDAAAPTTIHA